MNETKRTKEFKKNQLSDQEIELSHKSVTRPSKEGYEQYYCTWDICTKARYKDQVPARYIDTNVCAKW